MEREKEIVLTKVPGDHRAPRRPGGAHRPVDPPARAEEVAVGVRDPRLGPHADAARRRERRRRDGRPARPTSSSSTRATSPRRRRSSPTTAPTAPTSRPGSASSGRSDVSGPSTTPIRSRPSSASRSLDLLAGFIVELRARRDPGEPHREPRRHARRRAHPARGPRGVQVRARRHDGEEQRPLAGLRDGVRGVLLAAGQAVRRSARTATTSSTSTTSTRHGHGRRRGRGRA